MIFSCSNMFVFGFRDLLAYRRVSFILVDYCLVIYSLVFLVLRIVNILYLFIE